MTTMDRFTRAWLRACILMLFFGTLLVLSAHYRVVPFDAPKDSVENVMEKCAQNGTGFPTGVVMYGKDEAPHLFTDEKHIHAALVDQFGQNGKPAAHVLAISAFCKG